MDVLNPRVRGEEDEQVPISPAFYEQLFCSKVFCKAFL
jgi:hypothetical protein